MNQNKRRGHLRGRSPKYAKLCFASLLRRRWGNSPVLATQGARSRLRLEVSSRPVSSALATLVKVEGSAYRRPGARMLITSDGKQIGTISGGCLESDAIRRSQIVLETGTPSLVKYDTTSEDDLIWGLGLGCQGMAYVLIERLQIDKTNALRVIDQCLSPEN
ncbi:MAG: XdhC family protein [Cyanobacteria bacterium P01_A01_bin.84]